MHDLRARSAGIREGKRPVREAQLGAMSQSEVDLQPWWQRVGPAGGQFLLSTCLDGEGGPAPVLLRPGEGVIIKLRT